MIFRVVISQPYSDTLIAVDLAACRIPMTDYLWCRLAFLKLYFNDYISICSTGLAKGWTYQNAIPLLETPFSRWPVANYICRRRLGCFISSLDPIFTPLAKGTTIFRVTHFWYMPDVLILAFFQRRPPEAVSPFSETFALLKFGPKTIEICITTDFDLSLRKIPRRKPEFTTGAIHRQRKVLWRGWKKKQSNCLLCTIAMFTVVVSIISSSRS